MRANDFLGIYQSDGFLKTVAEGITAPANQKIEIRGLSGSLDAVVLASAFLNHPAHIVAILEDQEQASYFQNDLQNLLNREILTFPMSYKRAYEFDQTENANILLRTEVLGKISEPLQPVIIATYPEALGEKVVSKKSLSSNTFVIQRHDALDNDFLIEFLIHHNFEKADFVYEAGQFSVRGGIIDIFSFAQELPVRLEREGNEVESIRFFDPVSQLSVSETTRIAIIPNLQATLVTEAYQSFLEFLPEETILWVKDSVLTGDIIQQSFEKISERYGQLMRESGETAVVFHPDKIHITKDEFSKEIKRFKRVEFGKRFTAAPDATFSFSSSAQPAFKKNFDLLSEDLIRNKGEGRTSFIAAEMPRQLDRLTDIFAEISPETHFTPVECGLFAGFIDHTTGILCYTDHQIFERFYRHRSKEKFSKSKALTLRELQNLTPGDFVAHIDHGIGKFAGLEKKELNGKLQENIRLVFRDDDLLYVNIHSLHKISRYTGKEGSPPLISKLGSQEWETKKSKVKSRVKDIAKELINLYALRKNSAGFAFSPDNYLQAELESSFIYEDTPDQVKASDDVKKDMEQTYPMDRLVCGDVGFGKTEVAIRAAFKAIQDGKQVAVLVPTTILAMQHLRTFSERLSNFNLRIESLSRFRSSKDSKHIITDLKEGKINLLIGTHRLVGKDIMFKDLGLLIVDEEQKFGVQVKEKLKALKVNVDVLTLTATPIPRTLHFSLMGARDLSIISTPPPNRQPVTTMLQTFDETVIRDSVSQELRRGGQVFFVHNRVSDIEQIANVIHRLVPEAKIGIAHGQMEGSQLEKVMVKFIEGEFDVLASTNIIESGLDIPNANTIIINQAHMFGLSDLHQMRGRVGRSNKKAFCYLLTPPSAVLTADTRKRLAALEEFSELGDGFKVAMRDLDIRGAGNLLGAEQTGFINDLGYEIYHKILDDAVQELKETEFKTLFASSPSPSLLTSVRECVIETDLEILIPDEYVNNITERLQLYSRFDSLEEESQLNEFIHELADRFGQLPQSVLELADSVRLRWRAKEVGLEKIVLKGGRLKGTFGEHKADYYNSEIFGQVIAFAQRHKGQSKLREAGGRPALFIENISSVEAALAVFQDILYNGKPSSEMVSR